MNTNLNTTIKTKNINTNTNTYSICVDGINYDNAMLIIKQTKDVLIKNSNFNVLFLDCSKLSKFDSSIFTVILELKRLCYKMNKVFNYNLTDSIKKLASLYGVNELL